jgi:hypothetical protein
MILNWIRKKKGEKNCIEFCVQSKPHELNENSQYVYHTLSCNERWHRLI